MERATKHADSISLARYVFILQPNHCCIGEVGLVERARFQIFCCTHRLGQMEVCCRWKKSSADQNVCGLSFKCRLGHAHDGMRGFLLARQGTLHAY